MSEKQPQSVPENYKFYKKMGIFDVQGLTASVGWKDQKMGFELKPGSYFYELRLYNKPEGYLMEQVTESMFIMADEIHKAKHKPEVITAITYEKLGKIALRRGFREAEVAIPKFVIDDVERAYQETSPLARKGVPPGKTMLIYQPTNILLNNYKK